MESEERMQLIYDLEIIKGISPRDPSERVSGIKYCNGWGDHQGMGISVLCAVSLPENRPYIFLKDNLKQFEQLAAEAETLVTFNGVGFDDKVLVANGIKIPQGKSYDLLAEIKAAAGSFKGRGLNAMLAANGFKSKTGNGAMAPILWQQDRLGEVIDYCMSDVWLTAQLFQASQSGPLMDPVTRGILELTRI